MALNRNDPEKPNEIWAKDFSKPVGSIPLLAEAATIRLWLEEFGSEAKMGEFAGLVHGVWRDPDGANRQLSDGLQAPVAVFKGLKRPLFNVSDDADRRLYVYITNPSTTFRYPRAGQYSGGALESAPQPLESVFATYVTFERDHIDAECVGLLSEAQPLGLVVGWEWVERSPRAPSLPYDYDSRFDVRVL
jgi:hypothetical protein